MLALGDKHKLENFWEAWENPDCLEQTVSRNTDVKH